MIKKKKRKYNNKKTVLDGIVFDSEKEAMRYAELKLLERAGQIQDLQLQVPFKLIPSQYADGKCIERQVTYLADFVYTEDGQQVVEDTKGMRTAAYIIKRKLMLYLKGIRIKEI